ncbi:unnamed protein product [Ambrosiozyma monospora]|uniref:Unnamed protein product n=1 Tax=Ambrosiozyma monospora TaxID=43982 RepID=A0ACB5TQ18_AMBMO|nr:unnamed protein product [Ambrosiozyma monospora]
MKNLALLSILSLLGPALADWDPNTKGADYHTLTPDSSPKGDTNPTGTYGIALQTFDSNYMLFKRGFHKRNVEKAMAKRQLNARANAIAKRDDKVHGSSRSNW